MAGAPFITFEGGEGAGKSTQVARLREKLTASGIPVVTTREPGGTEGAEAIRGLLLGGAAGRWDGLGEALLVNAARHDHLERLIRPARARGDWVICDRFMDSTRAYQGAGRGVSTATLARLEAMVVEGDRPDLTLIIDLPVETGLTRAGTRARAGAGALAGDRMEAMDTAFHEALRQAFLMTAAMEPGRCLVIDGTQSVDAVSEAVWHAVAARFGLT